MPDDKKCIAAILKMMNEHKLQGSEVPAFIKLAQWVGSLESRLIVKEKPASEEKKPLPKKPRVKKEKAPVK